MTLDISKIKPNNDSSAEIEASLARIDAARGEAEAKLAEARASRETLLIEGSTKELRAAEQAIADHELDLERLALLHAKIEPTLEPARERERQAEHESQVAALRADIEASHRRWNKELEGAVRKVAELVEGRHALAHRAQALGLREDADKLRAGAVWSPPMNDHMAAEAQRRREAKEEADRQQRLELAELQRREFDRRNQEVAAQQRDAEEKRRLQPAVIQQRAEDHRGPGLVSSVVR